MIDEFSIDGDKTQKEFGVASDGEFWISRVLATIEALAKNTKHVELIQELDDDDQAVVLKARKLTGTLRKMAVDERDAAKGTNLLLSAIVLQKYNVDEEDNIYSDALEVSPFPQILIHKANVPADLCRGDDEHVCIQQEKKFSTISKRW